jgi:flagellar hook-associated protein 2
MPTIDGLISGLDTTGLIRDILRFQRAPLERTQARIKDETERRTALLGFTAKLLGLQSKANLLLKAASFERPAVSSTDEEVLTAQGGENLPLGSYTFRVRQLAQGAQYVSGGFSSPADLLGAGTLTIDAAGGMIERHTELEVLNGGAGVRRGSIRITDRDDHSAVIDLSEALTIDDVLSALNGATGIKVSASIAGPNDSHPGEGLVLHDESGGKGTLAVEEVAGGSTARDLGILDSAPGNSPLQGNSLIALGTGLSLNALNDGLGVRVQAGADLTITQRNGTTFTVDLDGKKTVGEVLTAINAAAGNTSVTVAISGRKLVATDSSSGGSAFSIANVATGMAATDLGLAVAASGGTITGGVVLADLDSVLLKSLRGGQGVSAGSIQITNRAGNSKTVDLSTARTTGDVLRAINDNNVSVTASVSDSGDGFLLTDGSGGSGLFKVEEVGGGSTASQLGILNATGVLADRIEGNDVKIKYVGENTLLAVLNGGRGVAAGTIRITDPSGRGFNVDLAQEKTIGAVLKDINGAASVAGSDLVASVNGSGNGIVLTASTGSGTLSVSEVGGGTTARDLRIAGSAPAATPRTLEGSFETSIAISAADTLDSLVARINDLEIGVAASVLNDGSALSPYRLQIVSDRPGVAGGITARTSGGTGLSFSAAARGRDAVLFYGSDAARPVVIRSGTNEFKEVIRGLSVTAHATSGDPVMVTASRDASNVKEAIEDLVETYNLLIDEIRELTRFDPATGERGTLLGDGSLRAVEREISDALLRPVLGLSSGENLASQLGLKVAAGGKLTFDGSVFDALAASSPDAVQRIFTQARKIDTGTLLADFGNGMGVETTPAGKELRIFTRGGASFDVDLTGDRTVRDLIASIRDAAGNVGKVAASISADGSSLVLTDATTGTSAFRVEALNGSPAAARVGLDASADTAGGGTITGRKIDLTNDPGVARRLFDSVAALTDATDGVLQGRADFYEKLIEDLKKRAESQERLLDTREAQLRRQFAQLEVILGQNQNTLQRLTASLAGLQGAK